MKHVSIGGSDLQPATPAVQAIHLESRVRTPSTEHYCANMPSKAREYGQMDAEFSLNR